MMEGLQIYYNFLRPHMALDGMTPAQKAKLVSETRKCELGFSDLRKQQKTFRVIKQKGFQQVIA